MKKEKTLMESLMEIKNLQKKIDDYYENEAKNGRTFIVYKDDFGGRSYREVLEKLDYGAGLYELADIAELLIYHFADKYETVGFEYIINDLAAGVKKSSRPIKNLKSLTRYCEY